MSLDHYVQGVIPAEMPASWSTEAVKAQAVAARTYADLVARRRTPAATTRSATPRRARSTGGVDVEDPRRNAAVAATSRQILTYGGSAAFTQFGSSSGGWLSAGSRPYLAAKADPYDDNTANPVHDWTVKLRRRPGAGRLPRDRQAAPAARHPARRARGVGRPGGDASCSTAAKRDVTLSGDTFRAVFGLRSSWFAG